ncbi:dephospho-CoA kinase [Bifidobacterium bombi]|uniref:Dephospho-CoA kinase n=1 Tax=Bifidobacterium bombi DSM 19703 TaxID=1341695 RepID=A0A080N2T6_9BIFI|nr:dephospho-CoA kinase [Bifidobacterium bombi]KFF31196.1 dephospho-CoA kinase [Bifidobacterium bombi DSM 19703]
MRLALTGGIAAGKSTVAAHLGERGVLVIDYDSLARQVVRPGTVALERITDEFGPDVLTPDGSLDRSALSELVFGHRAARDAKRRLDGIEHPFIFDLAQRYEKDWLSQHRGNGYVILHDVPLLAEVLDDIPFTFDHVITVEAPEELRVRRMVESRGMSPDQAWARIRHQSSQAERERIADAVVDGSKPLEQMFECVDMLVEQWVANRDDTR